MAKKKEILGFGFDPGDSQHHFLVHVPSRDDAPVKISEHFDYDEDSVGRRDVELDLNAPGSGLRVVLERLRWEAIAEDAKAEFNRRLKTEGIRTARWKHGHNHMSRLLGKELVLLAWAIEDAEFPVVKVAVRNWLGLTPEERWWLYTMTNAATGHATEGRNKGWRKAVRFALTENPVSDAPILDRRTFGIALVKGRHADNGGKKRKRPPETPLLDGVE
ncbi:MAG: DUF3780 domain-containing protein [Planctomycetota bacterium]|nr:DUF3780 domain-containing protein [Planctomycetota bacterium]